MKDYNKINVDQFSTKERDDLKADLTCVHWVSSSEYDPEHHWKTEKNTTTDAVGVLVMNGHTSPGKLSQEVQNDLRKSHFTLGTAVTDYTSALARANVPVVNALESNGGKLLSSSELNEAKNRGIKLRQSHFTLGVNDDVADRQKSSLMKNQEEFAKNSQIFKDTIVQDRFIATALKSRLQGEKNISIGDGFVESNIDYISSSHKANRDNLDQIMEATKNAPKVSRQALQELRNSNFVIGSSSSVLIPGKENDFYKSISQKAYARGLDESMKAEREMDAEQLKNLKKDLIATHLTIGSDDAISALHKEWKSTTQRAFKPYDPQLLGQSSEASAKWKKQGMTVSIDLGKGDHLDSNIWKESLKSADERKSLEAMRNQGGLSNMSSSNDREHIKNYLRKSNIVFAPQLIDGNKGDMHGVTSLFKDSFKPFEERDLHSIANANRNPAGGTFKSVEELKKDFKSHHFDCCGDKTSSASYSGIRSTMQDAMVDFSQKHFELYSNPTGPFKELKKDLTSVHFEFGMDDTMTMNRQQSLARESFKPHPKEYYLAKGCCNCDDGLCSVCGKKKK